MCKSHVPVTFGPITVAKRGQLCELSTPSSRTPAAWMIPPSAGSARGNGRDHAFDVLAQAYVTADDNGLHAASLEPLDGLLRKCIGRGTPHEHDVCWHPDPQAIPRLCRPSPRSPPVMR